MGFWMMDMKMLRKFCVMLEEEKREEGVVF
jgi:hypothetical protein